MPSINVGNSVRTRSKGRLALPLLALAAAVLLASILASGSVAEASSEPDAPNGFAVTRLLAGPAMFADEVRANFRITYDRGRARISNLPHGASNTITVEVGWAPGGTSGWHTHPGPAIVNVTEGAVPVTHAIACPPRTDGAGEACVDPGQGNVHIATNASGTEQAKAVATFLGVPSGASPTIMAVKADC